jgi:sulfoxide reductase catalytic subunit YedY
VDSRRHFIKKTFLLFAGNGLFISSISTLVQRAWAKAKRTILPKNTKMSSLINRNPAYLDTSNLEVIPIENFKTMGMTDHKVNLKHWRLQVIGAVQNPLELTYIQLLELPTIERNVLLICPGIFTNHGRWKGISVMELLNMAGAQPGIIRVSFRGPAGRHSKTKRFAFNEIASHKIFLAYKVNGKVLPIKHGFPLRVVAEDHYGDEWVKYVHKIEFHST